MALLATLQLIALGLLGWAAVSVLVTLPVALWMRHRARVNEARWPEPAAVAATPSPAGWPSAARRSAA